jgi:hypothetical protein
MDFLYGFVDTRKFQVYVSFVEVNQEGGEQ